jgi:hypothetical protein
VIDHLDDLESDFSAIHRVDDIYDLDGPQFFKKAWRMSAYQGVMRMRLEAEAEQNSPTRQPPSAAQAPAQVASGRAGPGIPPMPAGATVVDAAAFLADNADMVERVRV